MYDSLLHISAKSQDICQYTFSDFKNERVHMKSANLGNVVIYWIDSFGSADTWDLPILVIEVGNQIIISMAVFVDIKNNEYLDRIEIYNVSDLDNAEFYEFLWELMNFKYPDIMDELTGNSLIWKTE